MEVVLSRNYYRCSSQKEVVLMRRIRNANLVDIEDGRAYAYRKSLFKQTIKRSEICEFEDQYYCTYKFNVHGYKNFSEGTSKFRRITEEAVPFYTQKIPVDEINNGGIMLIVVIQWDAPDPIKDGRIFHLGTYDQAFFISWNNSQELDFAMCDTLSPVLFQLGITSAKENQSAVRQLVSCVIDHIDKEHNVEDDHHPSSGWIPVIVEIAVERIKQQGEHKFKFTGEYPLWALRDAKRVFKGLQLVVSSEEGMGAEECCPICLKEFKVEFELVRMPTCPHLYHQNCILEWLNKKSSCPLCRAPIREDYSDCKWRNTTQFLLLE